MRLTVLVVATALAVSSLARAQSSETQSSKAQSSKAQSTGAPVDVRELIEELSSADSLTRETAAQNLGRRGPAATVAIEPLVALFGDTDVYVRGAAAVALGRIGPASVPALVRALDDANAEIRWSAGIALGRLGGNARSAISALAKAVSDTDDNVRFVATVALGGLGSAARDVLPALVEALHDRSDSVRAAARLAVRQVALDGGARRFDLASVSATIDRLAPKLMAELNVPGVSVALVQDRRVAWSNVYGVSNATTRTPVAKDTVFECASMSKPIFGLLAMQLVEQKQLDLDRPLVEYAGEEFVPDLSEKQRVTARMALTHTSGYPNWRPGGEEREGPLPLLFTPGRRYGYSGEGIFYLQRVAERIAKQPLDRLAQTRLFGPLGLAHTSYAWTPAIAATQSTGHKEDGTVLTQSKYMHPNAAYSLYTTAEEYARLLVEVMKAEQGASALLSQASIREMLRHQVSVENQEAIERPGNTGDERVFRGLGWAINATSRGDVVHHGGSNGTGFRSFAQFSVERGTGLVILTNGSRGGDLWTRLVAAVGEY